MIAEVANSDELNTMIVVTHDIPAAVTVADTIWLLGRDRDEHGKIIPGAKLKKSYNLAEMGLAWREGISETREFMEVVHEIRAAFPSL
jgi:polar amino acid transport system ATP-binding protein/sulfate transport system ATP-binding protein